MGGIFSATITPRQTGGSGIVGRDLSQAIFMLADVNKLSDLEARSEVGNPDQIDGLPQPSVSN